MTDNNKKFNCEMTYNTGYAVKIDAPEIFNSADIGVIMQNFADYTDTPTQAEYTAWLADIETYQDGMEDWEHEKMDALHLVKITSECVYRDSGAQSVKKVDTVKPNR